MNDIYLHIGPNQISFIPGKHAEINRHKYSKTCFLVLGGIVYRKVTISNMFPLEAHAGFFRLHMKAIFDHYVL